MKIVKKSHQLKITAQSNLPSAGRLGGDYTLCIETVQTTIYNLYSKLDLKSSNCNTSV